MNLLSQITQFFKSDIKYLVMVFLIAGSFSASFFLREPEEPEPAANIQTVVEEAEKMMAANGQDPEFIKKRLEEDPVLGWSMQIFSSLMLVALLGGIVLDVGLVKSLIRKESWLPENPRAGFVNWGFEDIAKAIILFIFFSICLEFVLFLFSGMIPAVSRHNFFLITHTTIIDLILIWLIVRFLNKNGSSARTAFGFDRPLAIAEEIGFGVSAYLTILPVFLLSILILAGITQLVGYEPPAHPLVGVFLAEEDRAPWLVVYSLFLACILGPVVEEIFFRGFVYPVVRKKTRFFVAASLTAIFFAFIHESIFAFLPIYILGIMLAYLFEKRKSLVSSITLHICHNSVFIFYFFLIKRILLTE